MLKILGQSPKTLTFKKVAFCCMCFCLKLYLLIFLRKTFIYLFLLHWVLVAVCRLSLVAVSRGYSLVAVHRLLIVVASLVAEHGP